MKEFQIIAINGIPAIQYHDGDFYGTGEKLFFVKFCRTPEILLKEKESYIKRGYRQIK